MRRIFNVIETSPAMRAGKARTALAVSSAPAEAVEGIQSAWANALRCTFERDRSAQLCRLAEHTQQLVQQYPDDPRVQLWNGVVLTGYAKSLGGLCALQLQAAAKTSLEKAIELAPQDGAAYLYLGLLYDHSPTAPFSFGDENMARSLLEKGLALTLNLARPLHCA
ncbi:MAG TPA: hypothetical protein VFV28_10335 [Limnobacter sp.]|nr:hypothetical protein [Limnobacter sp.]